MCDDGFKEKKKKRVNWIVWGICGVLWGSGAWRSGNGGENNIPQTDFLENSPYIEGIRVVSSTLFSLSLLILKLSYMIAPTHTK